MIKNLSLCLRLFFLMIAAPNLVYSLDLSCGHALRTDAREHDKKQAKELMVSFMALSIVDPLNFYETPASNAVELPTISVKKESISSDKYLLYTFWQDSDVFGGVSQCWWLYLPLNLYNDFMTFRQALLKDHRKMLIEIRDKEHLKCGVKQYESLVKEISSSHWAAFAQDWHLQDFCTKEVKVAGQSYTLNMVSVYNPTKRMVLYFSITPEKPFWMENQDDDDFLTVSDERDEKYSFYSMDSDFSTDSLDSESSISSDEEIDDEPALEKSMPLEELENCETVSQRNEKEEREMMETENEVEEHFKTEYVPYKKSQPILLYKL